MEEEIFVKKEEEVSSANGLGVFIGILELTVVNFMQVLIGLFILTSTTGDCEKPIRSWIIVVISVFGFHSVFLFSMRIIPEKFSGFTIGINTLTLSFIFLWILVGTVWVIHDDKCEDDFKAGYELVLLIAIAYASLIAIVLTIFLGVTCIICGGAFHINRMLDTDDD